MLMTSSVSKIINKNQSKLKNNSTFLDLTLISLILRRSIPLRSDITMFEILFCHYNNLNKKLWIAATPDVEYNI